MATKKISELEAINAAEDNDVLVIVDTSESTTNKITKGNLLIGAGHTIEMTLNENYQIVLVLKNAAGTALSTQTIDLPNENAVTNLAYNNGILTVTKQSGATSQINLTGLIEGLVTESDFNTFKEALQTTLEAINEKDAEQDEAIAENYKVINKLNEKLENQQKVISQLPQVTGQGTEVTLENTIEAQFTKFDVEGNSGQETTEGRQLFNIEDYTQIALGNNGGASNIKTINKITVTTSSSSTSSGIYIAKENLISYITNYDSNTQYHLSMNVKTNRKLNLQIGCDTRPILSVEGTTRISVETLINTNGLVIYSKNQTEGDNIEITEIMVSTSSNTDYEPYTGGIASPNPNYEQTILSSGDNENLFDTSLLPITKNGVTISKDSKGNVVLNGTPTITSGYIGFDFTVSSSYLKADTYTISVKNKIDGIGISINQTTPGGIINLTMSDTVKVKTGTLTADLINGTMGVNVRYDVGTLDNFILNPKLEKGNKATPYSPHGMGSITEKIGNKNWNTSPLQDGSLTNGLPDTNYETCRTTNFIDIKPSTNYAFSINGTLNRVVVSMYDEEKNFIATDGAGGYASSNGLFTTYANAYYIKYRAYNADKQLFLNGNIQIEQGSTSTPYVEHEEQTYSIFVQQPMRSIGDVRDCFVKKSDGWYERHYFGKVEQLLDLAGPVVQGFYIIPKGIKKRAKLLSTHQQLGTSENSEEWKKYDGSQMKQLYPQIHNGVYINYKADTKQEQIDWWNSLNATLLYELETPLDLPCTETQIQQLENLPSTYKDFTYVVSEDETPAYLEVAGIYDLNILITRTEVLESEV